MKLRNLFKVSLYHHLQWEEKGKRIGRNIGMDVSLLKDCLSGDINYYTI